MKLKWSHLLFIVPVIMAGLSGCNYRIFDDVVLPDVEVAPDGSLVSKVEPTFAFIQQNVLFPKCIGCHSTGGSAELIPLESYEDLMSSFFFTSVVPGDPEASPLYQVVLPQSRRKMPPRSSGLEPVTPDEAEAIRVWIEAGAVR